VVDHDPRDLRSEPPEGAIYRITDAPLDERGYAAKVSRAIGEHLLATRTITLSSNRELKLVSRPGETAEAFAARCDAAADAEADKRAAAMAKKYEARVKRARDALATAADRVEQAEQVQNSRRTDEILSGAGDLIGSIFGGRRNARTIAGKVGGIARRRGRSSEAGQRAEAAANRVSEKQQALADLEADMADELAAIADEWNAKAAAIETIEVGLEKSDVRVTDVSLVWVPVA
jgi:hypothetical protein